MQKAVDLLSWLSNSGKEETGTGKYFAAQDQKNLHDSATDERVQESLLKVCEEISGVSFPKS
jgi:hypothetical protein